MSFIKVKSFIRFYLLAIVSTLLLLGLTLYTFFETHKRVAERNDKLFDIRSEAATRAIEKRMQDYIQILKGTQALFKVTDSVSRSEWEGFVMALQVDDNYPGIQGIGFSLMGTIDKLEKAERRIKQKEFSDFKIWPDSGREVASTILYLEPLNPRNKRAIGYDMFSDSTRSRAMQRARDTGQPALSGVVTLVQETNVGVQKGFLLYLSVYKDGKDPQTVKERRESIIGFVYSPFRANDLMQGILGRNFADLEIEVYDGLVSSPETLIYDKNKNFTISSAAIESLKKVVFLEVAQRKWQVHITALPGFGYETSFPYFVLGGGTLLSILMFFIIVSLIDIRRSSYLRQLVMDNANAAIFIIDVHDHCQFINPAAEELTGFTFHEIKKNTLHRLLHHSYPDGALYPPEACPILKTLEKKKVLVNHEDMFYRKNGEKFNVNINAQPIYQNGHIVGHLLEVRDITSEKRAQLALEEKNRNLEALNNINKSLSAELELKKLLQIVTDASTELAGAEFGAFFYNQIDENNETHVLHTLSGKAEELFTNLPKPRKTELFSPSFYGKGIIRSDDITNDPLFGNKPTYLGVPKEHLKVKSYMAIPVKSRNGEVIGGLFFGHTKAGVFNENAEEIVKGIAAQAAIAIDNSQLFEAISKKNEELTKINNDLDNFVYIASHDLKTPVVNIEGLIYLLSSAIKENKIERMEQIIEMMNVSVLKFKETIQALTEVSKVNRNLEDELEKVNLEALLVDIRLGMSDLIEETNTTIYTDIEYKELKFSKANLKSVLSNLITNSIKYRAPSRPPEIKISCKKVSDKVVLSVSDNGMGIPENHLSKVFMMFKRYHSHVEGTGVGLYLVKRIIENNGGTVTIESKVEKGTTFTITLPEL